MTEEANNETSGQPMGASEPDTVLDAVVPEDPAQAMELTGGCSAAAGRDAPVPGRRAAPPGEHAASPGQHAAPGPPAGAAGAGTPDRHLRHGRIGREPRGG